MDPEDAISIDSGESDDEAEGQRRAILEPAVRSVVEALGGYEDGVYRLGDECYGCLKDLKKFWRHDDTDDDRTVARIFWDARVLPNDLIHIFLETAGKGLFEDKCAIACTDLMTAMTWPIDLAEELKELDETYDKGADYTQLLISHLAYKAALLRPGVMESLLGILVPCLAKDAKERKERDIQIVNVVLLLVRNLAFIKDLPANAFLSADQVEYSSLQSRLIRTLSETNFLDLLLTIASNASSDPMFNSWNALVLEIFYLLFRGVKPSSLAMDQAKQPAKNLQRLLAVEDQRKRDFSHKASSRHSRFGTTISVKLNPKKALTARDGEEGTPAPASTSSQAFVLHRQQAIGGEAGGILDLVKRNRKQKEKKIDELAREDNLSLESRQILQTLAKNFVEGCFNPFLSSLLKDIKAERAKITEKDNLRLLYIAKWFLEFFTEIRAKGEPWKFELIAEVTERSWIVWVLRRMREAVDAKPKLWTELQAGIECLTQLVLIVDSMSSDADESVSEAAEVLQQQIVYNGEVLDIAFDSLRVYKEGTQSLAYLDSSVYLAYALLRMLERWGKKRGDALVRRKATAKRKRKGPTEEEGVPDVEEEPEGDSEEEFNETIFTFEMFEAKFAHADITKTLIAYLARHQEFSSSEKMKRVVGLMHRQAVRQKAEGLFFTVTTLELFKSILDHQKSLPREQPYKDLLALINFLLRKFFKAVEEDSMVIVEAFFPKTRGSWKHLSSWAPEEKEKGGKEETVEDTRFPPDVKVKKGYSWSEELGIAIACLVEDGKMELVEWTKRILMTAIGQRQRIIEDTDGSSSRIIAENSDTEDEDAVTNLRGPSNDAMAKLTDYLIPYVSDEEANAVTKDPHLKLLFRLVKFHILDENADELEWYIPAAILPSDLQRSLNVINQFLETPLDLQGKKASQLLSKKTRRRRRRRRSPTPEAEGSEDENPRARKRREKKAKEQTKYKSAQFIEDSDVEDGTMEVFLERERALREKTALAALASGGGGGNMKTTGTKKRRKGAPADGGGGKKKRRKTSKKGAEAEDEQEKAASASNSDSDNSLLRVFDSPRRSPSAADTSPTEVDAETEVRAEKPRPKPRPIARQPKSASPGSLFSPGNSVLKEDAVLADGDESRSVSAGAVPSLSDNEAEEATSPPAAGRKKGRLQISFSDDED